MPSLEPYVFERVFVLAYTGAYEWRRGAGWRRLIGKNIVGQGSSLNELRTVLSDPEWLTDPDGKAIQVAMECLRDMNKDGDKP